MKINTGFKSINKVTVTDIKKNHILAGTVVVSILAYLLMIIIGNGGAERSRWTAYAVFIYIIVLATPLIYYIRYSDKNKRIIEIVVYTKMTNVLLYQYLMAFYHIVIFSVNYGVLVLLTVVKYGGSLMDIYLFMSVFCILVIVNGLCIMCLSIFKRYYIGLIIYIAISFFCLILNSTGASFLFPLNYEIFSVQYFVGKLVEIVVIVGANAIRNRMV